MIHKIGFSIGGKATAFVVAGAMFWAQIYPTVALADAITDAARQGQLFGQSISPSIDIFAVDRDSGEMTLNPGTGNELSLQKNDLFPNTGTGGSVSDYSNFYDDQYGLEEAGTNARGSLATDTGEWGQAYRVLTETNGLSRPNLGNDPIWGQTDDLLDNFDELADQYADCDVTETVTDGYIDSHIPDYKTCEKLTKPEGTCVAYHDYKAGVISHVRGPYNIQSCGTGCMQLWIGRVGDNYWGGSCAIYQENTVVEVLRPEAVTSAVLEYAKWDDYMQVWLNESKVWQGPNGNFPPETGGACELSTSWERNPGTDLTSHFQQAGELDFKIRVSVTGGGEGYGRIRIYYDPSYVVEEGGWGPESCVKSIQGIDDGFCTGTYTCTSMPQIGQNGCAVVNGVTVCPDALESVSDNINPLCQRVSVTSDCNFAEGQMECWVDTQGVEHCPENDGAIENSCTQYEEDPTCGFIKSSCVGYAQGASGECYVTEETWDCGETVRIPTKNVEKALDCSGAIRCMGTECIDPAYESSTDFATAAAALQAAQGMAGDTDCDVVDIEDNNNCRIFPGEAYECKKAVGGIQNCCEGGGGGVGLNGYLKLSQAALKSGAFIDGQIMGLENSGLQAAYETLRTPVTQAWTEVNKGLITAWDTLAGTSTGAAEELAKEGIMTAFEDAMMETVVDWTTEVFGAAARDALFSQSLETGAWQLGGGEALLGTMLGWIMWIYMIYQIVMILIQIIWACEQKEFELTSKRELKTCHHVGSYCASKALGACIEKRESYCCFNSPLSRILQEQMRPQLGRDWGTPEEPECGPVLASDLAEVDFSQIDLSEWTGMLYNADLLPSVDDMNIENLTGDGSNWDTGTGRDNAAERALERLNGIDADDIRHQALEEIR